MSDARQGRQQSLAPLRLALGAVYFYFGLLKFYPDLSPAELLATQTIMRLSLHSIGPRTVMLWLALLECTIGAALLLNVLVRPALWLFLIHIAGTFVPLFVLPEFMFKFVPFAPTIEGEFIFKNVVFVAVGWILLRQVTPHSDSEKQVTIL